jgi:hypothetical protein
VKKKKILLENENVPGYTTRISRLANAESKPAQVRMEL